MSTIRIPLNSRKYPGLYALIDEADYELVSQYQWHPSYNKSTDSHYAVSSRHGSVVRMHRIIANAPDGMVVDHMNHDTLDNRRENLRVCTVAQNTRNRSGVQAGNKSGYLGVSWARRDKRWKAQIKKHGVKYHIGNFTDKVEAARARDKVAVEMFGEFAALNFPEEHGR